MDESMPIALFKVCLRIGVTIGRLISFLVSQNLAPNDIAIQNIMQDDPLE